ncbi:MAG: c-type cytochrome [Gammaproteobacteria bacterium]|nr:c-type cytochrome [Gammaproteobacteria bacterium]
MLAPATEPAASAAKAKETQTWNENLADKKSEQFQAMHLPADRKNGIAVYEACSVCHLTEGWGMKDGTFPQIAGQHRSVLLKQLADIRALNRDNPTMYPFAKSESIGGTQSMADVTDYIAKLPMNPANGIGPGTNLKHGKKLYKANCVRCHGENGEGDSEKYYPRIHGQHYKYMLRQFAWIRDRKRRNANPDMVRQIAGFNDNDIIAVIDYVSRLKPPGEMLADSPKWQNPDYDYK